METYDVFFSPAGIELIGSADDYGNTYGYIIPHIPASEAMAAGFYDFPDQERDIHDYMLEQGYSIHGLYAEDTTATTN